MVPHLLLFAALAQAATSDGSSDFERAVRPILEQHCIECHGPDRQKGGLRLDLKRSAMEGGDSGPAVVAGELEHSELWSRVSTDDEFDRMPPEREPLSAEEIGVLRRWIEGGAEWPESAEEGARRTSEHWAYQPFERPEPPRVEDQGWVRNPIDAFVLARLEQQGLSPSPEADRATLLRRLSLDLTGLPPTPEDLDAFLADEADDAYERAVDRLIASPHYGERWARHWLDLARYADSHGYTIDGARSIWRYRDWVIDALNADMPFDRFTVEQLAGDLLPDATLEQRIATGFHRNTLVNQEGGADDEEFRVKAVMDRVDATAEIWLGTTMACARCHTHKYDPFTQREYFQLYAFFNQTEDRGVSAGPRIEAPTTAEIEELERIDAEIAELRRVLSTSTPELERGQEEWERRMRGTAVPWTPLEPAGRATGGLELRVEDGGTLRAAGSHAGATTYTIEAECWEPEVTAVRLDVLADESLPSGGPGRADNGNFVLNEVRMFVAPRNAPEERAPVELTNPSCDHFQNRSETSYWPIEHVLDDDPRTGWAILPQSGQSHHAVFELETPLSLEGGALLTFELEQGYGRDHTIGLLRLSVTAAPVPVRASTAPEPVLAALAQPPSARDDEQREVLAAYYRTLAPELADARRRIEELERARPKPATTLVMRERMEPRPTHLFRRGSFLDPGPAVTPDVPEVLPPLPVASGDRLPTRLDLAQWLVSPEHPLTPRVTVNRHWQRFFGTGLVSTENDFGTRGARPTHPRLLDWLARELVDGGYRIKALHRLIVTSATYRQASRGTPAGWERDPTNQWLARQSRFRHDAETLRDAALVASGLLAPEMHGPPVYPPAGADVFAFTQTRKSWQESHGPARYRRSLYTWRWRSSLHPFLATFDSPDGVVPCTRRDRSNTPLQALTLANDPMVIEFAVGFARDVLAQAGSDEERLVDAFRRVHARAPGEEELDFLLAFLDEQRASFAADGDAAAALGAVTAKLPEAPGPAPSPTELAAFSAVTRVLLNTDEFQTRD